jgi:Magnesium chelatase, subunit ChlI
MRRLFRSIGLESTQERTGLDPGGSHRDHAYLSSHRRRKPGPGSRHDPVAAASLSGSRLVKNVTRLSRQQAWYMVAGVWSSWDIFYKQRCEPELLPGEVAWENHGILFRNERPEFRRHVLDVLRQPQEKGVVTIARVLAGIILIPHSLSYRPRPCFLALKGNPKPTKRLHLHACETPD